MYESFWGLKKSPFGGTMNVSLFHESPVHEEAIARLFYLIEQRRGFGLLTGPGGTGKSFLLHVISRQVKRSSRQVAVIDALGMDSHDLLWQLALELKLAPAGNDSRRRLWHRVTDQMLALQMARVQSVFVFDHLERAEPGSLSLIERLFAVSRQRPGQTTFFASIRSDRLARMPQFFCELADLRVGLPALKPAETDEFVRDLVSRGGCERDIFSRDAIFQVHTHSKGIARRICRLCEMSMIAAMSVDSPIVTPEIVDSVAEGLVLPHDSSDQFVEHHEYV